MPHLVPYYPRRPFNSIYQTMNDMALEMERYSNNFHPYWLDSDNSLHVGNEVQSVVNDDSKFEVSLDVSHFRPDQLKVNLDGRLLSIEGKQEEKSDHSFISRSFMRKWTLPEDVDISAVRSMISENGHLKVEAPKNGKSMSRSIPIMPAEKK